MDLDHSCTFQNQRSIRSPLLSTLMQKLAKWGVHTLEKIWIDCRVSYCIAMGVRKCKFHLRKFAYIVYRPIYLEMLN